MTLSQETKATGMESAHDHDTTLLPGFDSLYTIFQSGFAHALGSNTGLHDSTVPTADLGLKGNLDVPRSL